ncbi:MAG: helix-turn-helix domain-containing protein [Gemmataceae bacterium]
MSPSPFHLHFKDVPALSPLQYQKRLRLQEARRLMLGEELDAALAAFRVGYESPSQFSREYRQTFGTPPRQDVVAVRLEAETVESPAVNVFGLDGDPVAENQAWSKGRMYRGWSKLRLPPR